MKHNLKSDLERLKNRGMPLEEDVKLLENKSLKELIKCLNDDDAIIRTSAAINLKQYINKNKVCSSLLLQLSKEKSLYTKIAICETLQNGNIDSAKEMINYIGKIGDNQYKKLPEKVSLKKTYPMPRDIIARTLSKMNIDIFPILIDILEGDDLIKIYEVIDAVGFMVFHNKDLSNDKNLNYIINLIKKYKDNKLVLWKCITCLSAFNLEKSKDTLNSFVNNDNKDIFSLEAKRSLSILNR
ncbi:hypothetical protein [uncultured Brachyspira sp.]|uniref:hypothetical protein n=1 Tax=uncultured Brachyspira sp. TaxID=221953 RepID=UPI002622B92D|nr:hypothetical protein [uncultured Brachyspira sp.]